jgi:hypothetical protein
MAYVVGVWRIDGGREPRGQVVLLGCIGEQWQVPATLFKHCRGQSIYRIGIEGVAQVSPTAWRTAVSAR